MLNVSQHNYCGTSKVSEKSIPHSFEHNYCKKFPNEIKLPGNSNNFESGHDYCLM